MLKNLAKKVYLRRHSIIAVILVLSGVALVACSGGGGSSGGSTNTAETTKAFGLAARAQDQTITLSWPRINDAKKYNLYWSLTSGVTKNTGTKIADASAPYEHRGLSNGTPVYYIYTVETSAGEGAESLEISLTPSPNVSGVPDNIAVHGQDGRIELSWDGVKNATSYNVYRKSLQGEIFGNATMNATSPAVFTGLQNDLLYYFAVTAIVGDVQSELSNEAVAIPYAPETIKLIPGNVPTIPRHVYVYAGHEQTTIYSHDHNDALRYTIYWNTSGNVTLADAHISNVVLPYTHTGLSNGTRYYYRIAAQNQHGDSALAPSISISNVPNNDAIATLVADVVDAQLRACITATAATFGWSYQRQMDRIDCQNKKMIDLTGLQKFSNLYIFDLRQVDNLTTTTSNLSVLGQLPNLGHVGLSGNKIVDLGFLSELENLTTLYLSNNLIADLGPIKKLVNLEYLYLDINRVSDLAPLAGLAQLTELWVGHDPSDPAPYPTNRISTLEPLHNLTALTDLRFENNSVDSAGLSYVTELTKLQALVFDNNKVDLLTALTKLKQLRVLSARGNQITTAHLVDIRGLTNLESLALDSNPAIADISDLAYLTALRRLSLSSNQINNIAPLAGMSRLTALNLYGNLIADVRLLAELSSLEYLNLTNNQIGGGSIGRVEKLANLTQATYIGLGGNGAMSCLELAILIGTLRSPPVDLDGVPGSVDTPTAGVNCTNP